MNDDLISRRALYERATTLESLALDHVRKLIKKDGEEAKAEWKIWSAILIERTAFKHDVYDAPSAQPEKCEDCVNFNKTRLLIPQREQKKGKWIRNDNGTYSCSVCQSWVPAEQRLYARYCLYCGSPMGVEE